MSFQGAGTGISGYSAQFSVGYTGASTNAGYSGSSGNINGYVPTAGGANIGTPTALNINSMQGMNGKSWAWAGQNGTPSHLWGSYVGSQYAVWQYGQMYVGSVSTAYSSVRASNINGNAGSAGNTAHINVQNIGDQGTWAWAGQGGTPNHLWGSNTGANYPVYQYGQMAVKSAGYANLVGGATTAGYVGNTANSSNDTRYVNFGTGQCFQGVGAGGFGAYTYNNMNTGLISAFYVQTTLCGFFNYKRNNGGNTADRLVVYYNPENNFTQYGYFSNNFFGNTSDFRDKEEIEDLDEQACMNFIKQIKPRKFKLINDKKTARLGFVAQEVLSTASNLQSEALTHIVLNCDKYLEAGGPLDTTNLDRESSNTIPTLGVSYESFTVPLIKVVQTLMDDIKLLQIDITELESKFQ